MSLNPSMSGRCLRGWALWVAILPLVLASVARAEPAVHFDRWYVVLIGEDRAGWAHMRQTEAEGRIVSETQMHFALRRGAMTLRIEQESTFVETVEGQPIEASAVTRTGQMAQTQRLRFTDDGIEMTTEQAGRSQTRQLEPFDDDWLTPAAAQRYVERRMAAGDEKITVRTMDLMASARPFETTLSVVGEEEVEVFGRVVPAVAWEAQASVMPGIRTREYVDDRGRTLKSTTAMMPGMDVTMLAADEQLARSEVDPPELLASLFITPDRPLPNPRELRSAVYRLRLDEAARVDLMELPRAGYQRVSWGDERTVTVAVDVDRPTAVGDDLPREVERAASAMIDHEDPKVRELLDEALGEDAAALGRAEAAERLRVFVHEYITEKDLSVGLGTASEVARTGQGDCTEHAVLLAALLRAADIPARTVTGLIYVDAFIGEENVFGGHMWTQAWLPAPADGSAEAASGADAAAAGGRWVDLDAALPTASFDAAHIALGTSSMADDEMSNDMVALSSVLGGLSVEVVEPAE